MLGAMGFTPTHAAKALRETGDDIERAVEWLFSHPDEQAVSGDDEAAPAGESGSGGRPVVGSSEVPATFQLQSIVCHKGTSIHAG